MSRNFICFFNFSSCNFFKKKPNSLHIGANIELENSNNSIPKLKTSTVIEKDKINISVSTSFGLKILEMEYKKYTYFSIKRC